METLKVAIPSENPGGLEAIRSAHFGHCDVYTVVEVSQDGIQSVKILENPSHEEGGCLVPVKLLADYGVKKLLAGGMGQRPLMGFSQVGIDVFLVGEDLPTVGQAFTAFMEGKLPTFSMNSVCGGCGGH